MRHAATRRTTWVCDRMMPPLAIMRTVGPDAVSRHFSSRTRGFSLTLAFREIGCFPVRLGSTETRAAEGGAYAKVLGTFSQAQWTGVGPEQSTSLRVCLTVEPLYPSRLTQKLEY
jgi:hypothetical protein